MITHGHVQPLSFDLQKCHWNGTCCVLAVKEYIKANYNHRDTISIQVLFPDLINI